MKDLPQELIDNVIGYLPPGDIQSFRNCSLVAKSWIHSSRSSLFKSIDLRRKAKLRLWLKNVSSESIGLSEYVHSLIVNVGISSGGYPGTLASSLPLFPRLRSLVLFHGGIISTIQLGMSLAPKSTLESLSLDRCHVTVSTLAKLVNHFPNLVQVRFYDIFQEIDDEPTPPLLRPLRKLTTNEPDTIKIPGILDQFLDLRPQCEEVIIDVYACMARSLPQRIIDSVATTVKCLTLRGNMDCVESPLRLENCRELCELETHSLGVMESRLISTITSTHVRKITFVQSPSLLEYVFASPNCQYWGDLDNSLCELVDRSEHGFVLEVEYQFPKGLEWTGQPLSECLPGFHEKGCARVVGICGSKINSYPDWGYFSDDTDDD